MSGRSTHVSAQVICPGCGLTLPGETAPAAPPALLASVECYRLYTETTAEAMQDPRRAAQHQLCVDAYAAQHAGESVLAINTAFALIGLHLSLEKGLSGVQVRAAHKALADRYRSWPTFQRPASTGASTVLDVALASTSHYPDAVRAWASDVWRAWSHAHPARATEQDRTTDSDDLERPCSRPGAAHRAAKIDPILGGRSVS